MIGCTSGSGEKVCKRSISLGVQKKKAGAMRFIFSLFIQGQLDELPWHGPYAPQVS
jgi:hypothetical protein